MNVPADGFVSFLRDQADSAENANQHDLCAAFHDWADAIEAGRIAAPAPGKYGFVGGTDRDDIAYFVINVTGKELNG